MRNVTKFTKANIKRLNAILDSASDAALLDSVVAARLIVILQYHREKDAKKALFMSDVLYLEVLRRGIKL